MAVKNEIIVVVSKDGVTATATSGGAECPGKINLQDDQLRLATVKVFEELLLGDTIQNRRHMEVIGQYLYEGIFDNKIDEMLNKKISEVKNERLRLQLRFKEDVPPEIQNLPWEFMYSPTRKDFLATDVNLVLSHYIALDTDREESDEMERPLCALVVISRPGDEAVVEAKEVVQAIKGINKPNEDPTIKLHELEQPTLENIELALKEHQPNIFHFIGHGKYDLREKKGCLLLVDPKTGNSVRCDDTTLVDRFKCSQCYPRLVFLHMCEGGISEKDPTILQGFSGFAPKLLHAKIPSVVAMQYPIKNEDAKKFSVSFYSALAEGDCSVDEAVQEARRRLDMNRSSRVFGTPVLYMHSKKGLFIPKLPSRDKSGVSSEKKAVEKATKQPAVGSTQPLTIPQAVLENVINIGIEAAETIQDDNIKMKVRQQLFKMKKDLVDETKTTVYNTFFDTWRQETDPHIQKLWETMMEEIST